MIPTPRANKKLSSKDNDDNKNLVHTAKSVKPSVNPASPLSPPFSDTKADNYVPQSPTPLIFTANDSTITRHHIRLPI